MARSSYHGSFCGDLQLHLQSSSCASITGSTDDDDPRKSTTSNIRLDAAAITKDLNNQLLSCHAKSQADATARNATVLLDIQCKSGFIVLSCHKIGFFWEPGFFTK